MTTAISAKAPTSMPATVEQMERDIGILLASLKMLQEATGESVDPEDQAIIAQIEADHVSRRTASAPNGAVIDEALRAAVWLYRKSEPGFFAELTCHAPACAKNFREAVGRYVATVDWSAETPEP